MRDRLAELKTAGVSIWLDDLSRDRLVGGGLERMRTERHVVGITTNPTIFATALSTSKHYQAQLHELAERGVSPEEAATILTTDDVRGACDVMLPAYAESSGVDGRVSIEVDPRLADDSERTQAQARQLWDMVDRRNLFVKIPATEPSLTAIERTLALGISVNVTLIFSLERYEQVMEAFLAGMESALRNGHDLSSMGSVASFFVSRVDTEVDQRLEKLGTETAEQLRGQAAVANAQLAYQRYQRVFASPRWHALAQAGARPQRPLWASTSTKNPVYRDVIYVEELVAPGVVNTMPELTILAFADHGEVREDAVTASFAHAAAVFDQLAAIGIDMADVTATLEREGVQKFAQSWHGLMGSVEEGLGRNR